MSKKRKLKLQDIEKLDNKGVRKLLFKKPRRKHYIFLLSAFVLFIITMVVYSYVTGFNIKDTSNKPKELSEIVEKLTSNNKKDNEKVDDSEEYVKFKDVTNDAGEKYSIYDVQYTELGSDVKALIEYRKGILKEEDFREMPLLTTSEFNTYLRDYLLKDYEVTNVDVSDYKLYISTDDKNIDKIKKERLSDINNAFINSEWGKIYTEKEVKIVSGMVK